MFLLTGNSVMMGHQLTSSATAIPSLMLPFVKVILMSSTQQGVKIFSLGKRNHWYRKGAQLMLSTLLCCTNIIDLR